MEIEAQTSELLGIQSPSLLFLSVALCKAVNFLTIGWVTYLGSPLALNTVALVTVFLGNFPACG